MITSGNKSSSQNDGGQLYDQNDQKVETIKEIEKEIEETREKLLSILRPYYQEEEDELIEIKGKDMLFYGDCCKLEAKLEQTKEILKLIDVSKDVYNEYSNCVSCLTFRSHHDKINHLKFFEYDDR